METIMTQRAGEKEVIQQAKKQLLTLIIPFCATHLDQEYQALCEKLIHTMAQTTPAPFVSGRMEIWAAAIVYTLGSINFLFDKSFQPYLNPDDITHAFGVSKSTLRQKARKIREQFHLNYWDLEFSTKRMLKQRIEIQPYLKHLKNFGIGKNSRKSNEATLAALYLYNMGHHLRNLNKFLNR